MIHGDTLPFMVPPLGECVMWCSGPRATFGLIVRDGVVIEAAPYARRWCQGRNAVEIAWRLMRQGYEIRWMVFNAGTLDTTIQP